MGYKWTYCSHHDKDPFNTWCPQHQIGSPQASATPQCRHSLTRHEKLSEQIELPQRFKNWAKLVLCWHWAWTDSKSSQATQHLSHHTGGDHSKMSLTAQCNLCLNHPLQGASGHLCCLSHTNAQRGDRPPAKGSSLRTGSHCWELPLFKKSKIRWSHTNNTRFLPLPSTKGQLVMLL